MNTQKVQAEITALENM